MSDGKYLQPTNSVRYFYGREHCRHSGVCFFEKVRCHDSASLFFEMEITGRVINEYGELLEKYNVLSHSHNGLTRKYHLLLLKYRAMKSKTK